MREHFQGPIDIHKANYKLPTKMEADDRREREKEVRRGIEAKAILENVVWQETWKAYDDQVRSWMEDPKASDEQVLAAHRLLTAVRRLRKDFEFTMQTGQLAEMQLNEEKEHE